MASAYLALWPASRIGYDRGMRFQVSSLEAIGEGKALIGGVVRDGCLKVGDPITADSDPRPEPIQEIRAYGRTIQELPEGVSDGLVVSLAWATRLTLDSFLHD